MASKEATQSAPEFYAFEFPLTVAQIGEKTTNPQVKSKVAEAFMGWGAFTETQVLGSVGADRTVVVFFARLFGKGQPAFDSLKKNETVTIKIYDVDVEIKLSGAKPSGGGATTGTSLRPKKEVPKTGRGAKPKTDRAPKDGEKKEGEVKDGEKKEGAAVSPKKDGGRGRGRGEKKDEKINPSLQRGRANIGGKLGPISKVRLAKQAKEARDKENAARIARGEEPLPDPKAKSRDEEDGLPPKKEAGKGGKAPAKAPAKGAAAPKAPAKKK
jgi:hypothetical protein